MQKIGIIGAGPAGLMATAVLLESGISAEIIIMEKNSNIGGKILLTGGGRCNLTTALKKRKEILKKYTRGENFIKYALNIFPPAKVREWFFAHGLKTKIEPDNKIYPESDNAQSVVDVFKNIFKNKKNFKILFNTEAHKNNLHNYDYLIIATGGSGHDLAKKFGHTITQLAPSLTSFEVKEQWCKKLSGLSLQNCRIKFSQEYAYGRFIFTHFGISGPAVFALSSKIAYAKMPYRIFLIIDKNNDFIKWEQILMEKINNSGAKAIKNILYSMLPTRLADTVLNLVKINGLKKAAKISKQERQSISKILSSGLEINLISRRKGEEMLTAGGVDLSEISPQTCMSKIKHNLFFCGEILDVDAVTGGFNLHNCWMTGKLVAEAIIEEYGKNAKNNK